MNNQKFKTLITKNDKVFFCYSPELSIWSQGKELSETLDNLEKLKEKQINLIENYLPEYKHKKQSYNYKGFSFKIFLIGFVFFLITVFVIYISKILFNSAINHHLVKFNQKIELIFDTTPIKTRSRIDRLKNKLENIKPYIQEIRREIDEYK